MIHCPLATVGRSAGTLRKNRLETGCAPTWSGCSEYYDEFLVRWALSEQFPDIRNRTMTICFEDLTDPQKVGDKARDAMEFLNLPYIDEEEEADGDSSKNGTTTGYQGGHATSHDPKLREHLREVVEEVDYAFFSRELAWLYSILPCKKKHDR